MSKRRHKTEVGTEGNGREGHGESHCVSPRASTTTSPSPTIPFGNLRIELSCAGTPRLTVRAPTACPRATGLRERPALGFECRWSPEQTDPYSNRDWGDAGF